MTTVIRQPAAAALQGVNPPKEKAIKRRFFALLAVPALTLGFAFASPGTDEAQPYMPLSHSTVCAIAKSQIAIAQAGGDEESAGLFYANAKEFAEPALVALVASAVERVLACRLMAPRTAPSAGAVRVLRSVCAGRSRRTAARVGRGGCSRRAWLVREALVSPISEAIV
jgi:hypothetical protein